MRNAINQPTVLTMQGLAGEGRHNMGLEKVARKDSAMLQWLLDEQKPSWAEISSAVHN